MSIFQEVTAPKKRSPCASLKVVAKVFRTYTLLYGNFPRYDARSRR